MTPPRVLPPAPPPPGPARLALYASQLAADSRAHRTLYTPPPRRETERREEIKKERENASKKNKEVGG